MTSATGQAALVADAYQQWVVGATAAQAYDVSVLFANANNPGNPQVQAILKTLPNVSVRSRTPNQSSRRAAQPARTQTRKKVIVRPPGKPTWQQATALVSLSTCGAMTGFAFAHGTVDEMTSPTRHAGQADGAEQARQAGQAPSRRATARCGRPSSTWPGTTCAWRSRKSPAEMEALIWGSDSVDGVDHGQSCAAFASLTLALGAQATGQQSWVTGGTTYPWPLHQWADVRVDTNPDSPQITSVMQDAQAHQRWHPLGDGYQPQPGDWVLFDGHVEVVTSYSAGVLHTIGGDSAPNLSVNAHTFTGPLAAQGVTGFVNNGQLASAVAPETAHPAVRDGRVGRYADGRDRGTGPGGGGRRGRARDGATSVNGQAAGRSWPRRDGDERYGRDGGHGRPGAEPGTQGLVQMPGMMADFGRPWPRSAGDGGSGRAPRRRPRRSVGTVGAQARQATPAVRQACPAAAAKRDRYAGQNGATSRGTTTPRDGTGPPRRQRTGTAAIPGLEAPSAGRTAGSSSAAAPSYTRNNPPAGRRTSRAPPLSRRSSARSHPARWPRRAGTASRPR